MIQSFLHRRKLRRKESVTGKETRGAAIPARGNHIHKDSEVKGEMAHPRAKRSQKTGSKGRVVPDDTGR